MTLLEGLPNTFVYLGRFSLVLVFMVGCHQTASEHHPIGIANTLGVLTLAKPYERTDSIRFQNPDGTQWYIFTFYYDDSDGRWDFPNDEFRPLAFHPDYFTLALVVLRQDSAGYEVVVNQGTGLTKRIARAPFLRFDTWEEHLTSLFSVRFDPELNSIRSAPSDTAAPMAYPGADFTYRPAEVRGDWVRVEWGPESSRKTGWIRWKHDGQLLVDMHRLA